MYENGSQGPKITVLRLERNKEFSHEHKGLSDKREKNYWNHLNPAIFVRYNFSRIKQAVMVLIRAVSSPLVYCVNCVLI